MLAVRNGAVLRQHGELQQRGDEQEKCGLDAVHQRFGTSTITDCSDEKSTSGCTWMFLNALTSLFDALETVPIGIPRGNIDGSAPLPSVPAVMIVSPMPTYVALRDAVEHEHVAAAAAAL